MKIDSSSQCDDLKYEPGDHVAIFPANRNEIVDAILDHIDDNIDPDTPVQLQRNLHPPGHLLNM